MPSVTQTTYTKNEFLNAKQLAEKWGCDIEDVNRAMIHAYKRGITILIGNNPRPAVTLDRTNHTALTKGTRLQLHPLAHDKIKEIMAKGK